MSASTTNQRGAALLLVMWLIALLASLIGAFALSARIEHSAASMSGGLKAPCFLQSSMTAL